MLPTVGLQNSLSCDHQAQWVNSYVCSEKYQSVRIQQTCYCKLLNRMSEVAMHRSERNTEVPKNNSCIKFPFQVQWPYLSTLSILKMPVLYVVMCKTLNTVPSVTVLFLRTRTANGVPDTAQRPYQGVIYSQNAIQFYGTLVSVNHLCWYVWPFLFRLSRYLHQSITIMYRDSKLYQTLLNSNKTWLSMGFSKPFFTKCSTRTVNCCGHLLYQCYADQMRNPENKRTFSFTPCSKVRHILHWFSQNSQLVSGITWEILHNDFHKNKSRKMKIMGKKCKNSFRLSGSL